MPEILNNYEFAGYLSWLYHCVGRHIFVSNALKGVTDVIFEQLSPVGRSVQQLLSQGACPDLVGSRGVAAIHLAVGKETEKNTRCLKMLLQHGADPNIK